MPAPKSERLLNLLIMLLVQRRPIAKDRIRELLYADSRPDAFEKMFERDKEELRSLGVPVEVDLGALEISPAQPTAEEPAFARCWEAVCERTAIEFRHLRWNDPEPLL